jgi:hypothetical protein
MFEMPSVSFKNGIDSRQGLYATMLRKVQEQWFDVICEKLSLVFVVSLHKAESNDQ